MSIKNNIQKELIYLEEECIFTQTHIEKEWIQNALLIQKKLINYNKNIVQKL